MQLKMLHIFDDFEFYLSSGFIDANSTQATIFRGADSYLVEWLTPQWPGLHWLGLDYDNVVTC